MNTQNPPTGRARGDRPSRHEIIADLSAKGRHGWAVEVTVLDARVGKSPGTFWLKASERGRIIAQSWSRAQARAVARRQASLFARWARDSDGPDVFVLRDPEGDSEGDSWEVIEVRGSMGQDPQPIAACTARRVRFATSTAFGPSDACRAAHDPAAVAAMEAGA